MIVFSAAQALSPAIERTRRLLFSPFRWTTFLKLCVVAVLTEGFGGNFNFSHSSHSSSHPAGSSGPLGTTPHGAPFALSPEWIALIAAIVLASLVIGFFLFYLITRLRFSLFHCLAYQVRELRPGWTLYREQANRFFWFNLAVGLLFMLLVVLCVAPFVLGFVRIYKATQAGAHFDVPLFLSLFFPLLALLIVIALVAVSIDVVMRDFMLPHFALEDASARTAWTEVRTRIAAEKGSFVLYAVLRILLPIAALLALVMVLAIPMLILFGIFAAAFAGFHVLFDQAGTLGIVLEVVLGVTAVAVGLFLAICFGGPLSLWVRNFALVFYGGRYSLLGDVLFPPPPPPLFDESGMPTP